MTVKQSERSDPITSAELSSVFEYLKTGEEGCELVTIQTVCQVLIDIRSELTSIADSLARLANKDT